MFDLFDKSVKFFVTFSENSGGLLLRVPELCLAPADLDRTFGSKNVHVVWRVFVKTPAQIDNPDDVVFGLKMKPRGILDFHFLSTLTRLGVDALDGSDEILDDVDSVAPVIDQHSAAGDRSIRVP